MKIVAALRDNAAFYYRVKAPLQVLRKRLGLDVYIGPLSEQALDGASVLWLQQHAESGVEALARQFKAEGGKVVFDVDDWLLGVPPSWPCFRDYFEHGRAQATARLVWYSRLLALADVVTVTTPYLAQLVQGAVDAPIVVLPNCVLRGDWDWIVPVETQLDGRVLGWFGSSNHWDDWCEIADDVVEAVLETGSYLALIGAPELVTLFPAEFTSRVLVHEWSEWSAINNVRALIAAFDVGLAWTSSRFEATRARSPLKAIQYAAAGVPVVAGQTVYGEQVPELVHWSAASVPALRLALVEALSGPLPDVSARQELVWEQHSYESQALRWLEPLAGLLG